jgi:hypothetical protein
MPVLLQVCVVTVTISLLVIAVLMIRLMNRMNRAAEDFSRLALAIRESAARIDRVSHEAHALAISLQDCVPPVQRVVDRFETLGRRTADVTAALLETFEPPVFTAAAVAIGVRSGANHLLQRLMDRLTHRNTSNNGGYDHA